MNFKGPVINILTILLCLWSTSPVPVPQQERHIRVSISRMNDETADEVDADWRKLLRTLRHTRDRRQLPIKENDEDFTFVSPNWSNCRQVHLFCKVGLYTVVKHDRLEGVPITELTDDEGLFQLESYGKSLIRLKHVSSNRYITMTKKGLIELNSNRTEENLFFLYQEENSYDTFASVKYYIEALYDLFLSLSKSGRPRSGKNTYAGHKSSQFVAHTANRSGLCLR